MKHQSAVLLVNLGTPDAPTPAAIRRYLREFLSDRRVVDLPRALWYPVLYGFILPFRPRRLAHAYGSIWRPDGSPLLAISLKLAAALEQQLAARQATGVHVALGMRYGNPSIGAALDRLQASRPERLVVLPLYPQYSGTTTASALDGVGAALRGRDWQPALTVIRDYHDDPAYIAALRSAIVRHWDRHGRAGKLLISFHGIPERYVEAGDPYVTQCRATASSLAAALGLQADEWQLCFQSRIGKAKWTSPYTEQVLLDLARGGVGAVDVVCPGFAVDCLETLEEIAVRDHALFRGAGGQTLRYIPALNDTAEHAALLADRAAAALRE